MKSPWSPISADIAPDAENPWAADQCRILTVGDGDLSCSLALLRCFGDAVSLTASTLLSRDGLISTYSAGDSAAAEIEALGGHLRFQVDATLLDQLPQSSDAPDIIVFNYPHLGISALADESAHARRHQVLLAHFLNSAATVLAPAGCVQLTLAGNQPITWEAEKWAARAGLELRQSAPTSRADSFRYGAAAGLHCRPAEAGWRSRRKYRNGSLGSTHWLAGYGYEHRRCEGDGEMDVSNSVVMVFSRAAQAAPPVPSPPWASSSAPAATAAAAVSALQSTAAADAGGKGNGFLRCSVCDSQFGDSEALQRHLRAPALPDELGEWRCHHTGRVFDSHYALATFRRQQELSACPGDRRVAQSGDSRSVAVRQSDGSHIGTAPAAAAFPGTSAPSPRPASAATAAAPTGLARQRTESSEPALTTTSVRVAAAATAAVTVSSSGDGMRLQRWARVDGFAKHLSSKSQCEAALRERRLLVNGVAAEGSRVLVEGDVVHLEPPRFEREKPAPDGARRGVSVVYATEHLAVAWKPVGLRASGSFSGTMQDALTQTLQIESLSRQRRPAEIDGAGESAAFGVSRASSGKDVVETKPLPRLNAQELVISRLEIGCSGLCVLARSEFAFEQLTALAARGRLIHVFVALVHGRVPADWAVGVELRLPRDGRPANADVCAAVQCSEAGVPDGSRGQAAAEVEQEAHTEMGGDVQSLARDSDDVAEVRALCVSARDDLPLSSVRLSCGVRRGRLCGALCCALRHAGFPVVGDRFCRRERCSLPRSCAALKTRLQIGCYELHASNLPPSLGSLDVVVPHPDRLLASHWEKR